VRDQELERERPGEVRKNSDFTESRESRSATGLQMFESSVAFLRAPNLPATA
jgi:hypothetical protein